MSIKTATDHAHDRTASAPAADEALTFKAKQARPLFDPPLVRRAMRDALKKLDPRLMAKNPVMFVVEIGSAFTSVLFLHAAITGHGEASPGFIFGISAWLWVTVLFANFAEAMAEGRGKAQADTLRKARQDVAARRIRSGIADMSRLVESLPQRTADFDTVQSSTLRVGDTVVVVAGELIPADGDVVEGVASVDESAITGESAPVIREGGDRSAVTGGTRVLSDWLVVRVTANPGETFLDRMIAMVESAKRKKTPNEIALEILLAALSIVLLLATVTLYPYSAFAVSVSGAGATVPMTTLVALLVCLIPTTIGGLLSAIGIAGMDRMIQANVIAMSGRAVEASGDVDVLLLDKTGTITLGNRQATEFVPAPGVTREELADAAQLASLSDETPEGRSIVVLAKDKYNIRGRDIERLGATFVPFSAQTRMSGVDLDQRRIRKGAADAIERFVRENQGELPRAMREVVEEIARRGATPLVVAEDERVLGVVELKDIIKGGIKEKFAELRRMGIKTVPRPSPPRRASTTSSPRPPRKTSSPRSAPTKPKGGSWP